MSYVPSYYIFVTNGTRNCKIPIPYGVLRYGDWTFLFYFKWLNQYWYMIAKISKPYEHSANKNALSFDCNGLIAFQLFDCIFWKIQYQDAIFKFGFDIFLFY